MRARTGLVVVAALTLAGGMVGLAGDEPLGGAAPAHAAPAAFIFVTNNFGNSVTEYAQGANGDAAPVATLSGSNTGLNSPSGAALDASGNLFVTNFTPSVTGYAAGANGNASTIAFIFGSNTGLGNPHGENFDANGHLWVANPLSGVNSVTEYAQGANGNASPIATIAGSNTGINGPSGVAIQSDGTVVVANSGRNSVTIYANGVNGNVAPIATIAGSNTGLSTPRGVALDASGDIFVVNETAANGGSITEYPKTANGNASPTLTINGVGTGMAGPEAIALDSTGNVYVTNFGILGPAGNSVTEYAAGASGNATPIATIQGPNTGLNGPVGLTVVRGSAPPPPPVCLTGPQPGAVTLSGANACVDGATIPGNLTIPAGTNATIKNSSIGGNVRATGGGTFTLCASHVSGNVAITSASGFVLMGDGRSCPGNRVDGGITLTNNTHGVELGATQTGGTVSLSSNGGSTVAVEADQIGGSLACSGNSPAPTDNGRPNTVTGGRSGQTCAASGF